MPGIKEILKKQGGLKLFKQYFKGGALFTAICEFFLLGKSRTALEILRLSTTFKTKQKLEKKYKKYLLAFDEIYDNTLIKKQSNKVWVCWFQGMENAPEIVRKCYDSLNTNLKSKEIVLITAENICEYVDFPDFILEKWKKGIITHTHMTDLLRLELLIKYGGTWIDSTVLCTRDENYIPAFFFDSDLFFYQSLKPGRDGHASIISSWYMSACSNNKILMAVKFLCYEYWKRNNSMVDYFLLHDFMAIVLEYYELDWKKVVPFSNSTPHILLLRLFDEFDETIYNSVIEQTPFHKLSYKNKEEDIEKKDTYYARLFL